jgi:hypothetical protein
LLLSVPDFGFVFWLFVFIASTISNVSPSDTELPTDINGSAPGSACM